MKFYTTSKISENIHETPEGYLVCIGVPIARTGEYEYANGETPLEAGPDGKVMITRDAEEVFRIQTMASFEGKAVTITHPTEFVSPDNWKELAKGNIHNIRRGKGENENDLLADLLITDSYAINLVKNGLREVSCGYEAEYVQTGVGRGVQKNIIGNHLALVDQGRAGSAYAINDSKGKGSPMKKLSEKIQSLFGKAQDEALKLISAETGDTSTTPPVEAKSYDDLVQMVKDLGAKVDALKPGKDAVVQQASPSQPAEVVAKDEPAPVSLEERLGKLEAAVAKLVGAQVGDEDKDDDKAEDAESDVITDKDGDGDEDDKTGDAEMCDEDGEEEMTGDSASRLEILAPAGKIDGKAKDAKVKALKAAYATTDGKETIHLFTGGEVPNYEDQKLVDTIFIGASEVLKVRRNTEFANSRAKTRDFQTQMGVPKGAKTPEEINEIMAKHYGKK